jgi:hypothetical protein
VRRGDGDGDRPGTEVMLQVPIELENDEGLAAARPSPL